MASAEIEDKLNKGVRMHLKLESFNAYFKKWVKLYKSIVREGTQTNSKNSIKVIDKHFGTTPLQHLKKSGYQLFINEFGKDNSLE